MAELIGVLDDVPIRGVGLTRLAKTLHLKRPRLIPLWDQYISACYRRAPCAPVPVVKGRSWRQFAEVWLRAVQKDLTDDGAAARWRDLSALTPEGGPTITTLRALDIVGWRLGRDHDPTASGDPDEDGDEAA